MTKTEPSLEETMRADPGYQEVRSGLAFSWPEQFIVRIGMRGLNWMIRTVLDKHYPLDVFPQEDVQYGVMWGGEHAGADIDPGVKWVALLRMALKEVE